MIGRSLLVTAGPSIGILGNPCSSSRVVVVVATHIVIDYCSFDVSIHSTVSSSFRFFGSHREQQSISSSTTDSARGGAIIPNHRPAAASRETMTPRNAKRKKGIHLRPFGVQNVHC
jgi:hypothetical protein